MIKNYYLIKIEGKDVKNFLKSLYKKGILFNNIVFLDNILFCKLDDTNYNKLIKIKTYYKITVTKTYGLIYYKQIIKKNMTFILSFIIGIIYLFFLSNIIFKVNIIHDDKDIRNIIKKELDELNIKKYSFIKSYDYVQRAKNKIIENNKDKIEWIEIERVGSTYNIRLEKRIINKSEETHNYRHLTAKKSGIIKKIIAHDGEVIKKINDYVTKGDIIISGAIHKGEDIKSNVSSSGKVYAEVWYKVKVSLPIYYKEEKKTNNIINTIKIKYLNNEYNIFNKEYKNKKSYNKTIYSDFYNLFSINYSKDEEIYIIDEVNSIINEKNAIMIARDKIIEQLDTNEYIISQKKLKTTINNSTINVEVFFKVYEDISNYSYYNLN